MKNIGLRSINARSSSVNAARTVTCSRRSARRRVSRASCKRRIPSLYIGSSAIGPPGRVDRYSETDDQFLPTEPGWQGHRAGADAVDFRAGAGDACGGEKKKRGVSEEPVCQGGYFGYRSRAG